MKQGSFLRLPGGCGYSATPVWSVNLVFSTSCLFLGHSQSIQLPLVAPSSFHLATGTHQALGSHQAIHEWWGWPMRMKSCSSTNLVCWHRVPSHHSENWRRGWQTQSGATATRWQSCADSQRFGCLPTGSVHAGLGSLIAEKSGVPLYRR